MRPSPCCDGLGELGHQIQDRHIKEDKGPAPFGVEPSTSLPPWLHGMHSGRCASPVFPSRWLKQSDHTAEHFRGLVKIAQIASLRRASRYIYTCISNRGGIHCLDSKSGRSHVLWFLAVPGSVPCRAGR
jgi:hypothetical protein